MTQVIDLRVTVLSDGLHRALAMHPVCGVLLDPAARPLSPDSTLMQAVQPYELHTVPSRHREVDPSIMPRFALVDSSTSQGSDTVQNILRVALDELDPASLQAGLGRQVCAWWCCPSESGLTEHAANVRQHVSHSLIQRRESHTVLLRWHDPAVLWGLWPLLDDTQRTTVLGPIESLWLLDPVGQWLRLQRPGAQAVDTHLSLSAEQWHDIDHLAALNAALRQVSLPTDIHASTQLSAWRTQVMRALRRARDYGFDDTEDLALFAQLTVQVHAQFDQHPRVQERLQQRAVDAYFSSVIDGLEPAHWQQIQHDCASLLRTDNTDID